MSDLINRQDAIDAVERHYRIDNDLLEVIAYEIRQLPSAEHHKLNIAEYIHDFYPDVWRHAEKELEVKPSAQRKGKWLLDEERGATGIYAICSACDELIYITGDFKFCPNCGARMVTDEET